MGSWVDVVSSDVFPPAAENQSEKAWKLQRKIMNPAMLRFGRPVLQPWNDLSGLGNWNDFFYFYVLAFSHAMAGLHVVGGVSYLFEYVWCITAEWRRSSFSRNLFSFLIKSSFGVSVFGYYVCFLEGVQLDQTKFLNILLLIDRLLGGKDGRKEGKVCCLLSSSPRADRASNISRWVRTKEKAKTSHKLRPH